MLKGHQGYGFFEWVKQRTETQGYTFKKTRLFPVTISFVMFLGSTSSYFYPQLVAPSEGRSSVATELILSTKALALDGRKQVLKDGDLYLPLNNKPPNFSNDFRLQAILYKVLLHVEAKGLPTEHLSMSLVNLQGECCAYGGFQDQVRRYPASVVKLFWLVALYHQYYSGLLAEDAVPNEIIHDMIAISDNGAASKVLDAITQTESGDHLAKKALEDFLDKRLHVNRYFELLEYSDVNIIQKTFPIPYLQLESPAGRDGQLRQENKALGANYLTTRSVARLLYEIYTEQAVSRAYSQKIKQHLQRQVHAKAWQVQSFLGEALPKTTILYSKAGWTSQTRNDAAVIESADGRAKYILVVFGEDQAFYHDTEVFPVIAKEIHEYLTQ